MNITDLIELWNSAEGRPYKGSLIDMDAYTAAPDNIGCMCAQGQALHLLAGWEPDRLNEANQAEADRETAKLLNISTAHAVLLRTVNDKVDGAPAVVLTDPGQVLGDKWSTLLDFWVHLDGLTACQLKDARDAAWDAARDAARAAAGDAAGDAAHAAYAAYAATDAAAHAAADAAADAAAAARAAAGDAAGASSEIQGADILRANGRALTFLPALGFADPSKIPARPADYGPKA